MRRYSLANYLLLLLLLIDYKGVIALSIKNDLTGQTFGYLTVVERDADRIQESGRHRVAWRCICKCGNETSVVADHLTGGRIRSCGCLAKQLLSQRMKTHGETETKLYTVWCSMKGRCLNKNDRHYDYYGGRGISVCDEWKSSYEAFAKWAKENGYKDAAHGLYTLDRINVNGNYEPNNCRWVASVAQANNRRSNRVYTYNGETHNVTQWANIAGINPKTLFNRLYTGWSFEKAITTNNNNRY